MQYWFAIIKEIILKRTFIGNKADEFNKPLAAVNTSTYDWRNMEERWLCEYFSLWQKREYESLLHSVI